MDYIEAFKNLKNHSKYSRKTPQKAVLLLSIIDMCENCMISDNVIKYDERLKKMFSAMWNKVLPNEATLLHDVCIPFWYMQNEDFWHIVPVRGKEDILSLMNDSEIKPSETKIEDCVNYAELDEDLYFLMTLQSGRSSLKRALLETYTSLSMGMIDRMSASKDNFVDHSSDALNEYQNIINSTLTDKTARTANANTEAEQRFYQLNEDIQYVFNIEYYTFLKNHPNEREMFKDLCPSVYDLFDRITGNPVHQGEIAPSLSFTYENFLADLKITIMSEDGGFELIDSINSAIDCLHDNNAAVEFYDIEKENKELVENSSDSSEVKMEVVFEERVTPSNLRPLTPANESRNGKPWSENEEELILLYFNQGYSFEDIAKAMRRTVLSIKSRLGMLGAIDYSYERDKVTKPEQAGSSDEEIALNFYVENSLSRCSIFNHLGERVYVTSGKMKIFNGKVYRFNYKDMCFTVKDIVRTGDAWEKGSKKLVAYEQSDLYSLLDSNHFINQIEDFVEGETLEQNKMCVDGKWYNYYGESIRENNNNQSYLNLSADESSTQTPVDAFSDYIPKGKLKDMAEVVTSSYDYLWILAIIDFMGEKQQSSFLSYDELACMMIANAWELLANNPSLRQAEQTLVDCIEFLIEESHEYMDEELSWSSPKYIVYAAIKDYPMAGAFEDAVDEMLESSPYNILKLWINTEDRGDFVMFSLAFKNACLYALHPRKVDPYIEINPKWKNSLFFENVNLMEYFKRQYIEHVQSM